MNTRTAEALIAEHIEENPHRPGRVHARMKEYGTEVWAFIDYLQAAVNGDLARAAEDYEIPLEVAEAALAYYHQNRQFIDARIIVNRG
jgi:hypothetical protein